MIRSPVQRAANRTGLPDTLKARVEALSGLSMDAVQVHRNSPTPHTTERARLCPGPRYPSGARAGAAFAARSVVQQAQGRVRPTKHLKAPVVVNDEVGLEHEADVMGVRALRPEAPPYAITRLSRRERPIHQLASIVQFEDYREDSFGTIDKAWNLGETAGQWGSTSARTFGYCS